MKTAASSSSSSERGNKSRSPLFKPDGRHPYLVKQLVNSDIRKQMVFGHFRSPTSNDVVFRKETYLELITIDADGVVQTVCDQALFEKTISIAVIQRGQLQQTDCLVATSYSSLVAIFSFDEESCRFRAMSHANPSTKILYPFGGDRPRIGLLRPASNGTLYLADRLSRGMLAVDSNGCFIASCASADYLDLLRISDSSHSTIEKLVAYSTGYSMQLDDKRGKFCFLSKESKEHDPVFALLLTNSGINTEIRLCSWDTTTNCISLLFSYNGLDYIEGPQHISEVPYSYGYALVIRPSELILLDLRDSEQSSRVVGKPLPERPHSWCWEAGESNKRMILCLGTGGFFLVKIRLEPTPPEIELVDTGYSSSVTFTSLSWAENGSVTALAAEGGVTVFQLLEGNTSGQIQLIVKSSIEVMPPTLDMCLVDDDNNEQIFACCGVEPGYSLRGIRVGVDLETNTESPTGNLMFTCAWAIKKKIVDSYHSFIVLSSFLSETSVLSVDDFTEITGSVGFLSKVYTLACGLMSNGLLVQIHESAVRLCLVHPDGVVTSQSWSPPGEAHICHGYVGTNYIAVASQSGLFILGVRRGSDDMYEVYEIDNIMLEGVEQQVSCISPPQRPDADLDRYSEAFRDGIVFVIGTRRPSVQVMAYQRGHGIKTLAEVVIEDVTANAGYSSPDYIPERVIFVKVNHRLYIVSMLRGGMLIKCEWPLPHEGANESHPAKLLISSWQMGMRLLFLAPLGDLMDADIFLYGEKPWLLQAVGDSLSLNSLSFQGSYSGLLSATSVCTRKHPNGILFTFEDRLQLMTHRKTLNLQKCDLSGTPLKMLYHAESRLLLVLRRVAEDSHESHDICFVDPMSGSVVSCYKLVNHLERPTCMELLTVGSERVLVVGTSRRDADRTGRLIVLNLEHKQNSNQSYQEGWNLKQVFSYNTKQGVSAICPYSDRYFVVAGLFKLYVCHFENNNLRKIKRLVDAESRYTTEIIALTTHSTTIAVSGYPDIHFCTYNEATRKLMPSCKIIHEPVFGLGQKKIPVACHMVNVETALVSIMDKSPLVFYSLPDKSSDMYDKGFVKVSDSFSARSEFVMNMIKGPRSHKLLTDAADPRDSVIARTASGGILMFIPVSREQYKVLKRVQLKVVEDPLIAPVLGSDYWLEHGAGCFLDGDMLGAFLKLSDEKQKAMLPDDEDRETIVGLLERAGAINDAAHCEVF